jgi:CRP-like cAMP-binding protein
MKQEMILFNYLQQFVPISEEEFREHILPIVHVKHFKKKEIITNIGDVEDYYYFIVKGLVRKYYKKGRDEVNTQISTESQIIHSQESFYSRTPSEYVVEAVESCTLLALSYADQERTYLEYPKLERLGRMAITKLFVIKDRWQMQMVKYTPRERFINFFQKNPELVSRVPQKYLASYLNIKPETFSRFKHLLRVKTKD